MTQIIEPFKCSECDSTNIMYEENVPRQRVYVGVKDGKHVFEGQTYKEYYEYATDQKLVCLENDHKLPESVPDDSDIEWI